MVAAVMKPAELASTWRARAEGLRRYAPAAARAFQDAAAELEAAMAEAADEVLTLAEASRESGYSARRLRELVAAGGLPNAGRKGVPRLRRADLPRKGRRGNGGSGYDAEAHARELVGRVRP